MSKTFIAANWKMNPAPAGFDAKDSPYRQTASVDVVVFPVVTDLQKVRSAELMFGAQGGRPEAKGSFTGDVSIKQLADAGCRYVLCGHSERRKFHGEDDDYVMQQVIAALENNLHPILCIGETEEEDPKNIRHILKKQLQGLPADEKILIAYEPSWAIGSGTPRTPDDVQEIHSFIRSLLEKPTRILYGASVNEDNAAGLIAQKDVDGFIVGGASLDPVAFRKIVAAAEASSAS